jgi:hypothetical protein
MGQSNPGRQHPAAVACDPMNVPFREFGPSCFHVERRVSAGLARSVPGQSETPNHVRSDGSFPPKRSPGAGGGCTASHCQPRLLLMAELAPIADAGAGDPGICNGPTTEVGQLIRSPRRRAPAESVTPSFLAIDSSAPTHDYTACDVETKRKQSTYGACRSPDRNVNHQQVAKIANCERRQHDDDTLRER